VRSTVIVQTSLRTVEDNGSVSSQVFEMQYGEAATLVENVARLREDSICYLGTCRLRRPNTLCQFFVTRAEFVKQDLPLLEDPQITHSAP
jgi:hypothetical protein